jgi:hypothetical protein
MRAGLASAFFVLLSACHPAPTTERAEAEPRVPPSPPVPCRKGTCDAGALVEEPCTLLCTRGKHCELQNERPVCIEDMADSAGSCATALCPAETYCDDIGGTPKCIPLPSCANMKCVQGQTCQLVQVQCIRAPCPPQPTCLPPNAMP